MKIRICLRKVNRYWNQACVLPMSGIYVPGRGGIRIEDDIVITKWLQKYYGLSARTEDPVIIQPYEFENLKMFPFCCRFF